MVDRFHHRVGDVKCGEVHQLKRAELEANLVFQDAIDGGEVGYAFAHQPQSLGAVTASGVVNNEARRILGADRGVAHLPGKHGQGVAHGCVGLQASDDLYHLHQRHRIKEVKARQPLRPLEPSPQCCDRQRRGVAGQNGIRGEQFLELAKKVGLGIEAFHNRLYHQLAGGQLSQGSHAVQARLVASHLSLLQSSFVL